MISQSQSSSQTVDISNLVFWSQKIYFEISVVWDYMSWNVKRNMKCVHPKFFQYINVWDIKSWLYLKRNKMLFLSKFMTDIHNIIDKYIRLWGSVFFFVTLINSLQGSLRGSYITVRHVPLLPCQPCYQPLQRQYNQMKRWQKRSTYVWNVPRGVISFSMIWTVKSQPAQQARPAGLGPNVQN